ncbi:MBL fold metallo-hydrolase [Saccharopolyspora rosea]|uniref:MBL fold metallo-hydrolase n=1 Tax=Saccharopolyspora rosea TaxID=524884 RepID=A0ABW3FNJ5_9PSEU|nr:MBL fold metallo-hydrolase [Saccharopolyspora rosea]
MPAPPAITPLDPAVTVSLQLPGGWFLNNAGWITGRDRALLVDTHATEARTRHLLDGLRSATTPGTPFTAAITHAHGDHANGAAAVVRAGGTVTTTAAAARDIATGPHTYDALFDQPEDMWGEIAPPELTDTLAGPRTLDLGGTTAEIHPVPTTAHTDGDLVVWVPEHGVLFTGDLLFNGVAPLSLHGDITGWLDALDWLKTFQPRHLVPGHGPLSTTDDLDVLADYFRWLLDAVHDTDHPDFPALEERARSRWPAWHDAERHAVNLRVAHAGASRDVPETLRAMLSSAGGPIPLDLTIDESA